MGTRQVLIDETPVAQAHAVPALSIEDLGRRFGSREVIEALSLELEVGQRVALRGPNGSGKTTVLRCVAGTVTPTRGSVSVSGFPTGSVEARRLVGASLSQERSFYLRLTGHVNLLVFARMKSVGRWRVEQDKLEWEPMRLTDVGVVADVVQGGGGKLSPIADDPGDVGKPVGLE